MRVPSRMLLLLNSGLYSDVAFPCCKACESRNTRLRWLGAAAMQACFTLTAIGAPFLISPRDMNLRLTIVAAVLSLFLFKRSRDIGGRWFALFYGTYYPSQQSFVFRFRRHEFAQLLVDGASRNESSVG